MVRTTHRWKEEILGRDKHKCYYCDEVFSSNELHLDHIIPKSKGGRDKKENLTASCLKCNLTKRKFDLRRV